MVYLTENARVASQAVKNPPASTGEVRDSGSVPELERSSGGGHGNPFQCFCLESPMDGRA